MYWGRNVKKNMKQIKEEMRMQEKISSRFEFVFYKADKADKLPDETRALVKDKDGFMEFAIWYSNDGWYDEGSVCYSGGIGGKIENVVEFALNGCSDKN